MLSHLLGSRPGRSTSPGSGSHLPSQACSVTTYLHSSSSREAKGADKAAHKTDQVRQAYLRHGSSLRSHKHQDMRFQQGSQA